MRELPPERPPQGAPPEDPWEAARLSARADVAAVLAPRQRTCHACGHVQSGSARTCSECGADLVARRPRRRWRWRTAAAMLLALAVAVAAVAVVTAPTRRGAKAEAQRQRARQTALEAAEAQRLRIDVRPHFGAGPARGAGQDALAYRRMLVAAAERLITADAQARVRTGKLKGPVVGTACAPYPYISARRAAEADPAAVVGRYDCVAYSKRLELPELQDRRREGFFGYPFWAVIDYRRATIAWCKVTPRAGEGGKTLAHVPVPPPCRDPLR
jgi:predicted nucleic acid-binding Zn ribbon protein